MRAWVLLSLVGCSEYAVGSKPETPDPVFPKIEVDPTAIDFGEAPYGESLERPFTITNVGDAPLHLGDLAVVGDPFSLQLDPSDAEVSTGDSVEGSVVFSGGSGEQFGQVKIPSDDPENPEVTIDLHGIPGLPGLLIEPNPLDFGIVEVGTDTTLEISLTNLGDEPLDLLNATVGEPFWLGQIEPIVLEAGETRGMPVHFTPTEPIPYESLFTVTVEQLGELSVPVLGAGNSTPSAVCGALPMSPVIPVETVTWVGSGSSDPASRPLTYSWSLVAQPAGSTAVMPSGAGPDLSNFIPDVIGDYTAELTVTNDLGVSDTCSVTIVATDSKPTAQCSVSPNPAFALLDAVTWSGAGSSDPSGSALTYSWSLVAQPAGSAVSMPSGAASNPDRSGFIPDLAGLYTGQLIVTNTYGISSDPCIVNLDVVPAEDLWVEMFWSNSGEDMDLHLVRDVGNLRSGQDCYFSNCLSGRPWGTASVDDNPFLDLDDIPGTGPENINIASPENLVYHVWVHDYPGSVRNAATDVTVNIYLGGVLVWTDTQSISGEDTDNWFADIDWSTQTVTP